MELNNLKPKVLINHPGSALKKPINNNVSLIQQKLEKIIDNPEARHLHAIFLSNTLGDLSAVLNKDR